jgi:signal transduction histidine kinase
MRRLIDQLLILVYGFILACSLETSASLVVALLIALIYLSVMTLVATNNRWLPLSFTLLFCLSALFCPLCLLFSPLVLYHLIPKQNFLMLALTLIVVGYLLYRSDFIPLFPIGSLLAMGAVFAIYAQSKTHRIENLETILQKTRDDGKELTLLLQDKNRSLREKQDYEIYTATLKERNRIAREIHDNVGHMLSRAILITGAIKMTNPVDSLAEPLENLDHSLGEAMDSIRKSVHDLHDEAIDLQKALEDILADFTFCQTTFSYHMGKNIPRDIKYNFIAIVKEALNNVIKHSQAQNLRLAVSESESLYQLIIEDDGRSNNPNLPTNPLNSDTRGIGLINMTERVKKLHGHITLYNQNGFRIYIKIPKD